MDDTTARLSLPLLAAGQAQKEMTHNEALTLIDLLVQPVVETAPTASPPASPAVGTCWLVAAAPTGAWTGQAGAIAGWTVGGWRFAGPRAGWRARVRDVGRDAWCDGTGWTLTPAAAAVATPTGGTTVDSQCRSAITALIALLRAHGMAV